MPSLGDIVNTITIRGVADGVDATTAATKGLKDAFDAASTAAKSGPKHREPVKPTAAKTKARSKRR